MFRAEVSMKTFVALWWLWLLFVVGGYGSGLIMFGRAWKTRDPRSINPVLYIGANLIGSIGMLCLAAIFLAYVFGRIDL